MLRARSMTVCLAVVAMAFVSVSCTKNVTVTMKDGTKMVMKEGDMMTMDGEVMKHHPDEHGH